MNTKQTTTAMRRALLGAGLVFSVSMIGGTAMAQRGFGFGGGYPQQTGEALYKGICQGCHMPDGKGAVGAGAYPALAANKKLGSKFYPVLVVVKGQKAMPEFGSSFSDVQVANVVNYIRSHFGNSYTDDVTPDDVKKMRPVAK